MRDRLEILDGKGGNIDVQVKIQGVSVVVPVYKSLESLRSLVERIVNCLRPLGDYEVTLVDDRSPGETWSVIQE